MSLKVSENGGSSSFAPLEEGSYAAVCYEVIDLGMQESKQFGNSSRKVLIGWEIADEYVEINGEKQPRTFTARYTASLNEKAVLRRDLVAWRGKAFSDEELELFDLANIIDAPCLLQVVHKETNGKVYANLAGIIKLPKSMPRPKRTLDPIVFDIDESDLGMIEKLPEWIANTIKQSSSYEERLAIEAKKAAQLKDLGDAGYGEGNPFEGDYSQEELNDTDDGVLPF